VFIKVKSHTIQHPIVAFYFYLTILIEGSGMNVKMVKIIIYRSEFLFKCVSMTEGLAREGFWRGQRGSAKEQAEPY